MALEVFWLGLLFVVGLQTCAAHGNPEVGIRFLEEPSDVVAVRGRSATLTCRAWTHRSNKTTPTFVWLLGEQAIVPDRRREILDNGSLFIKKVQSKSTDGGDGDQGEYRCIVQTPFGSLSSRPATLFIAGMPHDFSQVPQSQTAAEGETVRLACNIDAIPSAQISWTKDEQPLPQIGNKYLQTALGSSSGVLYVQNLTPEDSGNYRCIALNELTKKTKVSPPGQLTVTSKPADVSGTQPALLPGIPRGDIIVAEFSNATLECATNAPTKLYWFFDNSGNEELLANGTDLNVHHFQIINASRGNSGTYICRTRDGTQMQRVLVTVQTSPTFLEKPHGQMFFAARTIRFSCWVRGEPEPTVQWLKDGIPVHINGRIKHKISHNQTLQARSSELIISSSVGNDSGIYQCMVRSAQGVTRGAIWAAARLSLNTSKPPPVPPTQVACEALGATQVLVTWLVPVPRPDVKAFSIHYSLTDGGEERQLVAPHYNRSSTVGQLVPFTNYTFYVRAYTDSASDFSEKVVCLTGEDVPIGAPVTHVESGGPNSLRVFWKPLPANLSHGEVTEYKVQWGKRGKPYHESEQVGAGIHEFIITDVVPGVEYDVRVLAATKEGWPTVSLPWYKFSVPARPINSLPAKPVVHLKFVNSSAVLASWNLTHTTDLQGYKVFLRPPNGQQNYPILLSPNQTTYLFMHLEPAKSYEAVVLGFTAGGEGETAVLSFHTEGESESVGHPPEPPVALEAEPISSSAIRVSWAHSSDVAYYTVCYNPVQTSLSVDEKSIQCIQSTEKVATVKGLTPYTHYEFKVMSHDNLNRSSGYSRSVECSTKEEVPSVVPSIHWKAVNKSAVRVTWREPVKANGLLKNYTISYTKTQDKNLPVSKWTSLSVPGNRYSAELVNMSSQAVYALVVRAATGAGFGPTGAVVIVSFMGKGKNTVETDGESYESYDQNTGVIAGVTIGAVFVILSAICIFFRRRCNKARCSQQTQRTTPATTADCASTLEMEYLSQYTPSQPQHVDTKGHYPVGAVNGVRLPLSGNGRVGDTGIRITDNPRYDPNVSDSPVLGLQPKNGTNSRRCSDLLNDSNLPLLGSSSDQDATSNEEAKPKIVRLDCNGYESKGTFFPPVRGKIRPPAGVDIFDVPDSPPSKPAPLIIDFQFV